MASLALSEEATLPADGFAGALAARVWRPDVGGPSVVAVRADGVFDISAALSDHARPLRRRRRPPRRLRAAQGPADRRAWRKFSPTRPRDARAHDQPRLLAPIDLQAIKAAGVTFAQSMLERVIEERARGAARAPRKRARGDRALLGEELQQTQARLARRDAAQGGADRGRRLVAISGSRHRPGRRGLHQEPADVGGRLLATTPVSTAPRAGTIRSRRSRSRSLRAAASSARRSPTTSICAISRGARRCCWARRRTRTRAARSGRSCASSTRPFRSTTCARRRSR